MQINDCSFFQPNTDALTLQKNLAPTKSSYKKKDNDPSRVVVK